MNTPEVLPRRPAYDFATEHGLRVEAGSIRRLDLRAIPKQDRERVRKGYMTALFEEHGLLDQFIHEHWPDGATPWGARRRRKYQEAVRWYENAEREDDAEIDHESAEEAEDLRFALEEHLRDFLAKNLDRIEKGLRLYQENNVSGIEFSIGGARIDLLAIDESGKYVVIELKVSQARNKTLGQLLYYMGVIDEHLGNGPCRGMIIASQITPDLIVAASRVQGVTLGRYKMTFVIEPLRQNA